MLEDLTRPLYLMRKQRADVILIGAIRTGCYPHTTARVAATSARAAAERAFSFEARKGDPKDRPVEPCRSSMPPGTAHRVSGTLHLETTRRRPQCVRGIRCPT